MSEGEKIYKAGEQSEDDPFVFVLSTDTRDRHGDIVEQDFNLTAFKRNPMALWGHSSGLPIGTWGKLRKETVEQGKRTIRRTLGRLELAAPGTSKLIDFVRSMIEQRILRTVSIGFMPGKWEAIDEDNPWDGFRCSENDLLECSVVTIPANPEAMNFAKSLDDATRAQVFAESGEPHPCDLSVAAQLGLKKSRVSDGNRTKSTRQATRLPSKNMKPTINERITTKTAQLTAFRDKLQEVIDGVGDEEDAAIDETAQAQIEELKGKIDMISKELEILHEAEAGLAMSAIERPSVREGVSPAPGQERSAMVPAPRAARGGDGVIEVQPGQVQYVGRAPGNPADLGAATGGVPYIEVRTNQQRGHRALATMATMFKAHVTGQSPYALAADYYKSEPEVETLVKAATLPAVTTVPAWAGALVRETWAEFIELIRDISVYPRLPGTRMEFDQFGKIIAPRNEGRGQLAGGFIGESAPIPVKQGAYGSTDLQPKEMKVITVFSKKIAMHSVPQIENLLRLQLLEDTAEALDTHFMSATARSAEAPAGIRDTTETGAANIVAATAGATVSGINGDTKAMIERMLEARAGTGAVWLLSPLIINGLWNIQDAASGQFVYRASLSAGTFQQFPYISSMNLPGDVVALISNQAFIHANDYAPMIDVSDQATLHMDDAPEADLAAVTPGGGVGLVQSLFQTDNVALKMALGMDYRQVRAGGVQVLTGVQWK